MVGWVEDQAAVLRRRGGEKGGRGKLKILSKKKG